MNQRGKQFKEIFDELRLTPEEVCIEADLSVSALYKVFRDDPTARPSTVNRVGKAIERIKEKRKASA